MPDFKKINEDNIVMYRRLDNHHDPESGKYICTVCGSKTSISGSFSNQGDNLICTFCANKFENSSDIFEYTLNHRFM